LDYQVGIYLLYQSNQLRYNSVCFLLMTPSRIKDGLNETQILAAGAGNIAALMTPRIFDQLYAQQRNALRLAVYGEDAELEDIPITEDLEQEEGVQEIEIFGDDSGEADIIQVESTQLNQLRQLMLQS
uniref:uncharacterized protein LOC120330470 n=1 Tax=Styela clava TaxID=7725 RepID=UPI001939A194